MKWEMEILSPVSYLSSSSWQETKSTKWTPAENKMFEKALAVYDKEMPDRWQNVAAMIPGKTVVDVIQKYKELEAEVNEIEAGLIPIPGYSTSPFTLDYACDGFKQSFSLAGKRSTPARPGEHERKKGVPWTEEEHKLFLLGLKKYGKGDWRNISRNFVVTRTPTQVASHAQKYFIRQLSGGKDKRRASIHDITTVNLPDPIPPSPDTKTTPSSEQPARHPQQQPNSTAITGKPFCWNQPCGGAAMAFDTANGNVFMSSPYVAGPYGHTMEGHNLQSVACDSSVGSENMIFEMQSSQHYTY